MKYTSPEGSEAPQRFDSRKASPLHLLLKGSSCLRSTVSRGLTIDCGQLDILGPVIHKTA